MAVRRSSRPLRVAEVLRGYLARSPLSERLAQADVVNAWPDLVGERVAGHATAESVTPDGTLFVRVPSAAWRQELTLMAPEIMARLNAGRRTGRIEHIRWVQGG